MIHKRISLSTPNDLEISTPILDVKGFKRIYWLYVIVAALIGASFADFALIAYHFQKTVLVSSGMIPIFYAVAMGVDGVAALFFGRLFDKVGLLSIMMVVALLSSLFAPMVFLG